MINYIVDLELRIKKSSVVRSDNKEAIHWVAFFDLKNLSGRII